MEEEETIPLLLPLQVGDSHFSRLLPSYNCKQPYCRSLKPAISRPFNNYKD
jgi:hypothetical protein